MAWKGGLGRPSFFCAWYPCPMMTSMPAPTGAIGLVGFDGDDTLWKSEDYYRKAEQDYLDIL